MMIGTSTTLLNKYDVMPSSIIDFHFGSLIFPGGEDHGLPTPSSNKTQPPGSCILFENFTNDQQYLESEEIQNPVPDKLVFRSKGKITRLYVQYSLAVTDHKEQLTKRRLRKNKLEIGKFSSIIFNPFHGLLSYLSNTILSPVMVTYSQFMDFA